MKEAKGVYVVVPDGVDDAAQPSGGNTYDRRICIGLAAVGWTVHEQAVAGSWPHPSDAACAALTRVLQALPDGALVLVDGLIASVVPRVLLPQAARLRLVVLMHMPLALEASASGADERDPGGEGAVLSVAAAVIATSEWTRRRLLDRYRLPADRVHVATPGVDAAPASPGTAAGTELLCVAAVTPVKGHDVLFAALSTIEDLPWRCLCVGSLDRNRPFVDRLNRQAQSGPAAERIRLVGPLIGAQLDSAYATADLLVLPSRAETYGMVITEALARGLPVVASRVGGVPEAVGSTELGRPGLLVAPGDPSTLAAALRRWLVEPGLRAGLRRAAADRRTTVAPWSATTDRIAAVLAAAAR